MTSLILLAVSVAVAILAGRFLGWDSCLEQDDREQMEYLSKWSDAERVRRDMRALRGGK